MPITRLRPTFTFDEDRVAALTAALRTVVPEAFADGAINWETLRAALGEHLEEEDADGGVSTAEHFGLFWPGKRAARRLASAPSKGTLVPQPGLGVNEATTRNLFIEGDNLEVLKLLLKSYAGRVKLIYIDPPYNTGNDFVYPDDYSEPLEAYLRRTGQVDEEGQALTTNMKTGGRLHSKWLSMMYPRLRYARELLREDGVIWISIDDTESAHLQLLCNEVFGEGNFVAQFVWEKRITRENRRVFSINHDYLLCYAKDKDLFQESRNLLPLSEEVLGRYSNPDNDPRGEWQSVSVNAQAGHATPNQFYEIVTPGGRRLNPPPGRCWVVTKERFEELVADNRVWFGYEGNNVPRLKVFLQEANLGLTPHTLWKAEEVGTTDSAKKALINLFDDESVFDTPKPVELIKRVVQISTSDQDWVVDFFSGSCTTAHAVLELNQQDNGNRRYIMVQLPDPTKNCKYPTIADIGRERIRRVIARMEAEAAGQPSPVSGQSPDGRPMTDDGQLQLLETTQPSLVSGQETTGDRRPTTDLGFRSYRLTRSHFKAWQDYAGEQPAELETLFTQFESPLVEGWEREALLTELLLLEGFPLDSRVRSLPAFTENALVEVTSDFCAHRLTVCLDARIQPATLAALKLRVEDTFICLDSALTDEAKITLADKCNLKVV